MLQVIRSIVKSVTEGVIKRFEGTGRPGESFKDREYFQHYGFTSRPLPDAEAIVLMEGNRIIVIASDDRRYRLSLDEGEVALYTDEGDHIHLKRSKEIYVYSGNKVMVEAENLVDLNGGTDNTKGVVQGDCLCPFTGKRHIHISSNVRSSI